MADQDNDNDGVDDAELVNDADGAERRELAIMGSDRSPVAYSGGAAGHALAQAERAIIEAHVLVARQFPRHLPAVRARINKELRRPSVAERAMYALPRGEKPVCSRCGGDWKGDRHACPSNVGDGEKSKVWVANIVEGESIKMANMMQAAMGNMTSGSRVVADDDDSRTVRVRAMDWESMSGVDDEIVIRKVVERKEVTLRFGKDRGKKVPPDRELLGPPRKNSKGELVYLCRATEDEIRERQAALVSKSRRQCILALVPEDIREDARKLAKAVAKSTIAANRLATIQALKVGYGRVGVDEVMLADYLGRAVEDASADQLELLGGLLTAITDKESGTTWESVMKSKADSEAATQAAADGEAAAAAKAAAGAAGTVKPPRTRPTDKIDEKLGDKGKP